MFPRQVVVVPLEVLLAPTPDPRGKGTVTVDLGIIAGRCVWEIQEGRGKNVNGTFGENSLKRALLRSRLVFFADYGLNKVDKKYDGKGSLT